MGKKVLGGLAATLALSALAYAITRTVQELVAQRAERRRLVLEIAALTNIKIDAIGYFLSCLDRLDADISAYSSHDLASMMVNGFIFKFTDLRK